MSLEGERLIRRVKACESVAVTGLSKNAGKTEALNFLLGGLKTLNIPVGVTSIGVDGETTDRVTLTSKPEITLFPGTLFATTETHYAHRQIQSEVLDLGRRMTPLGRVVFSRALGRGKSLLSGPSDIGSLSGAIRKLKELGAQTILVDGALSRQSLASPALCQGMVLATGAAVSRSVAGVASATGHMLSLIALSEAEEIHAEEIFNAPRGISAIEGRHIVDLGIPTALSLDKIGKSMFTFGTRLIVNGAVTDRFLKWLASQQEVKKIELIVRDFTCLFVTPLSLSEFRRRGGRISVAKKPQLLALTMNPYSPDGYRLDAVMLKEALERQLERNGFRVPVLDVRSEKPILK